MEVHSSGWKLVYNYNQSSVPERIYLIYSKIQQNEKFTQNYARTTSDGSVATIQGLGKVSIKWLQL